jgi:hypothetical protein
MLKVNACSYAFTLPYPFTACRDVWACGVGTLPTFQAANTWWTPSRSLPTRTAVAITGNLKGSVWKHNYYEQSVPSTLPNLQLMRVYALLHSWNTPCPQPKKGIWRMSHTDQKTKPTNYHFIIFGKKLLWCHGIWWEWMPFWHCLQHFLIYIIWQRKYSGFIRRHLWTDKMILITCMSLLWKKCIKSSITSRQNTQ